MRFSCYFPPEKRGLPKSAVSAQYQEHSTLVSREEKMHPWAPPFDLPWDSPPPPVESSGFFTRVAWSELRCPNQNGGRIVVVSSRLLTEDVSFLDLKIVHIPSKESNFLWISKNYVRQQVWKNNVNLACVFTSTAFGGRHLTCGSSSVPFIGYISLLSTLVEN